MGSLGRYMRRNTAAAFSWVTSKRKLAQKIAALTAELYDKKRALSEEQNNVDRATFANQSLSQETRQLQNELTTARDEIAILQSRVELMNIAYGLNRELVKQAISTAGGQNVDRKPFGPADERQLTG